MKSQEIRLKINQEFENIECSREEFDNLLTEFSNQYLKEQSNLLSVSHIINANYFVSVLKRALNGNDSVKVEFENERDQMDYILDVCNNFKKELEKDSC